MSQPPVSARLEDIRTYRYRAHIARQHVGHIEAIDPGREADIQLAVELILQTPGQRNRNRMQSTAAHVNHLFLIRQILTAVGCFQCVRQFQIKFNTGLCGTFPQRLDQCNAGFIRQVMFKGDVGHLYIKAQFCIQYISQPVGAQQSRIELDGGV